MSTQVQIFKVLEVEEGLKLLSSMSAMVIVRHSTPLAEAHHLPCPHLVTLRYESFY